MGVYLKEGRLVTQEGVVIVAKKEDKFLMIKQYRSEFDKHSLEFPGGGVDDESAMEAAAREFQEEAGYILNNGQSLGKIFPSIYLYDWIEVFLGEVGERTESELQDDEEIVSVHFLTVDEIKNKIKTGEIISAQTIAAFGMVQ
jgi:8-oxo-dGTP pyrophosphatase MutT (NUDIX family)